MPRHGTLLCIDDDADSLRIRQLLLEHFGYKVCASTSGREGLKLFRSHRFDAVLVDYQMPEMNGAQVASEIRRLRPQVPILMLSAYYSLPESVTRSVDLFVSKTAPATYLVAKVDQLVGKAHAGAQPAWVLAVVLGAAALVGLVLRRFRLRRRRRNQPPDSALPKTA